MDDFITRENFILQCAKHYDSKHFASTEEFYEDVKRIGYIRKLVTRYIQSGDLKERLILNHIITLNNVFGPTFTCRILFFKLGDMFEYIKPFLVLLNILPDKIYLNNNIIDTDCIVMDTDIIEALRKI